jgi:hypothetical protein
MYAHPEAGRNDHVHGDEEYYTYIDELKNASLDDVLKLIANGGSCAYDWIKLLKDGDLFYHLVIMLAKGQDKPEYKAMVEELKIEIEGWLN